MLKGFEVVPSPNSIKNRLRPWSHRKSLAGVSVELQMSILFHLLDSAGNGLLNPPENPRANKVKIGKVCKDTTMFITLKKTRLELIVVQWQVSNSDQIHTKREQ